MSDLIGTIITGEAVAAASGGGIKSGVIVTSETVANTVTETIIWTGAIPADTLVAGAVIEICVNGILSNASGNDNITIRKYIGATLLEDFTVEMGNVSDAPWEISNTMTVRTIGAMGAVAFHGYMEINGNKSTVVNSVDVLNTTIPEDITVTVQWANAKTGNVISALQGYMVIR